MEDEFSEKKAEAQLAPIDSKVYEAAICFARIWGVMETLEPLPNIGFEKVRDISITLAKEFVLENDKDLEQFFAEKAEALKRKYIS
ncbi:MAG: hypothetical protein K2K21_06530 [Lachnospiraceae bacterium]|nr:hypothetical protein [Lachnospiraceae bacterium]